jgi:hypothetical protein
MRIEIIECLNIQGYTIPSLLRESVYRHWIPVRFLYMIPEILCNVKSLVQDLELAGISSIYKPRWSYKDLGGSRRTWGVDNLEVLWYAR